MATPESHRRCESRKLTNGRSLQQPLRADGPCCVAEGLDKRLRARPWAATGVSAQVPQKSLNGWLTDSEGEESGTPISTRHVCTKHGEARGGE